MKGVINSEARCNMNSPVMHTSMDDTVATIQSRGSSLVVCESVLSLTASSTLFPGSTTESSHFSYAHSTCRTINTHLSITVFRDLALLRHILKRQRPFTNVASFTVGKSSMYFGGCRALVSVPHSDVPQTYLGFVDN